MNHPFAARAAMMCAPGSEVDRASPHIIFYRVNNVSLRSFAYWMTAKTLKEIFARDPKLPFPRNG
jgi:hypothetical protein